MATDRTVDYADYRRCVTLCLVNRFGLTSIWSHTMKHWHVATGLAGYGPDAADSDGFAYAVTPRGLADLIKDECERIADSLHTSAYACADGGDHEDAWATLKQADEFGTLAMTFDNKRANAPLYATDSAAWDATIVRLIGERFPADFEHSRLYVWECEHGTECESGPVANSDEMRVARKLRADSPDSVEYVRGLVDMIVRLLGLEADDRYAVLALIKHDSTD